MCLALSTRLGFQRLIFPFTERFSVTAPCSTYVPTIPLVDKGGTPMSTLISCTIVVEVNFTNLMARFQYETHPQDIMGVLGITFGVHDIFSTLSLFGPIAMSSTLSCMMRS